MKIIKQLILSTIFILTLISCKKDKLIGDNTTLIGTWTSISTLANCGIVAGQPYNPDFKLELIERGKYKLYQGGKKIEQGRLIIKNNLVTFECIKKKSVLDARKILKFNSDTLNIDRNGCNDDYEYRFVKN
jgi:hypothetical protein